MSSPRASRQPHGYNKQQSRSEIVSRSSEKQDGAAAKTPHVKNPENSIVSAPERWNPRRRPINGSSSAAALDSRSSTPGKKTLTGPSPETSSRPSRVSGNLKHVLIQGDLVQRQPQGLLDSHVEASASVGSLDQQQQFRQQSQPAFPGIQLGSSAEEGANVAPAFGPSPGQGILVESAPSWRMSVPRMMKNIENALLERDRVLEQLAMLSDSRTEFDASLDRIVALTDIGDLPDPPVSQRRASDPDRMGSSSHFLEAPRSSVHATLFHRGSEPSVMPHSIDTKQMNRQEPRAIIAAFRRDLDRLRGLEHQLVAKLELLSSTEFRLKQTQEALLAALKDPETAAQIVGPQTGQSRVPYQRTESSKEASNVPSVVQQYFDKAGDFGVWLDRREEVQDAWDEGRVEREFIADRGDPLEVTDEVFNANFEERLANIDRKLEAARDEAEHLRHRCTVDGYDTERWRIRRRSFSTAVSSEPPASRQRSPSRNIRVADRETFFDWAMTTDYAPAIDSWLRTVPASDVDPNEFVDVSFSGLSGDLAPTIDQGPPEIIPIEESPPVPD